MLHDRKFYKCAVCGNIVGMIHEAGPKVVCCNQEMGLMVPNTVDAAKEKHVPVAVRNGNLLEVQVGSVLHPMLEEHHIAWILVAGRDWTQRVSLPHTGSPVASFCLPDEDAVSVYEYCNLHGLWATDCD